MRPSTATTSLLLLAGLAVPLVAEDSKPHHPPQERPAGDRPQGDRGPGDRPQGGRGPGDRPGMERPFETSLLLNATVADLKKLQADWAVVAEKRMAVFKAAEAVVAARTAGGEPPKAARETLKAAVEAAEAAQRQFGADMKAIRPQPPAK